MSTLMKQKELGVSLGVSLPLDPKFLGSIHLFEEVLRGVFKFLIEEHVLCYLCRDIVGH
jgi:hypothetical protein